MTLATPPAAQSEFAYAAPSRSSPWKRIFRIVRWTTYAFAFVTLILLHHKAPPPIVETSPQAAARAEEKFEQVEKAVAHGQPATLRLDETELNSYLASHLDLAGDGKIGTSELQSPDHLVCRLLLEKKNTTTKSSYNNTLSQTILPTATQHACSAI